jgi:hypothetical protein
MKIKKENQLFLSSQKIKRLWEMPMDYLPEHVRTEHGERTV